MARNPQEVPFEDEGDEQDVAEQLDPKAVAAVVSGTDWTTETIVAQLTRGNIQLDPKFQRRDAWKLDRKSRFIESLIVGLPIPQIVIAESKRDRGRFIVLDGKQRLLAIMQFWGLGEGPSTAYKLSSLTLRKDLIGKNFIDLSTDSSLQTDFNALCNQTIRTIVIRNWKDTNLLHTVFLRLNTGSVSLSPQELRQALLPGPFSSYVDDAAANSQRLHSLLKTNGPDPRMRDTEILARFLAFRFFAERYPGRMKEFLDDTFETFNAEWVSHHDRIVDAIADFDAGIENLLDLFGDNVARKPSSRQFNRAIFDALIYYHSRPEIRATLTSKSTELKAAYKALFATDSTFLKAVESDTAGAPNTAARLKLWAETLSGVSGLTITPPDIPLAGNQPMKLRRARARSRR